MNPVEIASIKRHEQWKKGDFFLVVSETIAKHVDENKVLEALRKQHAF